MTARMQRLIKAMIGDLLESNPPLTPRFCEQNEVTGEEHDELCAILARGAEQATRPVQRFEARAAAA